MQECASSGEMKTGEFAKIPKDWDVVALSNVVYQQFRPERNQTNEDYRILGVRWYAVGPFEKARKKGKNIKAKILYLAKENDFIYNRLFAWKGSFGVIPKSLDSTYVSNEFPLFRTDEKNLNPYFLWRYFSQPSVWAHIEDQSSGTAKVSRLRYKEKQLTGMFIPLPSLPEQRRIVYVLSTIQEVKEKTEAAIAATRELKESLMKHLFTYGPVPIQKADKVPLKVTEIGLVPEWWDVAKLGDSAKIVSGGTPSREKSEYWNGDIPWVKTGEVNYCIITKTDEKISKKGLEESSARIIPSGTLLMAMYGEGVTRGRVSILGIDAAINQACAAILPFRNKNIDTYFLFYLFSYYYKQIRNLAHGTHQKNLSATLIKTIKIPIPPLPEQQQIAHILTFVDRKIKAQENKKNALDALFQTFLHDLMTGKIRVNHLEMVQ